MGYRTKRSMPTHAFMLRSPPSITKEITGDSSAGSGGWGIRMRKLKRLKQKMKAKESSRIKISEILWEYAGNFFGRGRNLEERRQLLKIAVLAWNLSLFPEEELEDKINEVINNLQNMNQSQENIDDKMAFLKNDIKILVAGKRKLFPHVMKYIVEATIEVANGK
jgi:hypothetical protein